MNQTTRKKGIVFPFILFFIFLVIPLISADVNEAYVLINDVFKINEQYNYSVPCLNDYTERYCSSTSTCNFTVFTPNFDVLTDNQEGTNAGTYHYLPITFTEIGNYRINVECIDGIYNTTYLYVAQVTGSGFNDTFGFYILIFAISFVIILLGIRLKDGWVAVLGSFGLYFLGFYILFYGIVGLKDMVTTYALGLIVLVLAMYISIRSIIEMTST